MLLDVESDRTVDNRIGESSRKEKLINVLSPWSTYEFRISAANKFGYGPPSAPSPQVRTPSDKPSMYPNNIRGGGGNTGTLTIVWDVGVPISCYLFRLCKHCNNFSATPS